MLHFTFVFIGIALCVVVTSGVSGLVLSQVRNGRRQRGMHRLLCRQQDSKIRQLERNAMQAVTERLAWTGWQRAKVEEIIDESADCRSFFLTLPDGTPFPPFRPGQYLMVGINDSDTGKTVSRCYSLSAAPDPRFWRISVKRVPGGLVSNYLHDHLKIGDTLLLGAPRGKFVPQMEDNRPLVMIAAGVGITPMIAMIRYALIWQPERPLHLYYQLRDGEHAPFLRWLTGRTRESERFNLVTCFSQPGPQDQPNYVGRISADLITKEADLLDGEFLICGPDRFMKSLRKDLIANGILGDAIKIESFGGGQPKQLSGNAGAAEQGEGYAVSFQRSKSETQWRDEDGSLLDVTEQAGVDIDSGCRAGECGACVVGLLKGKVKHLTDPLCGPLDENQVAACIAVPEGPVELDL